jgi:hypothetical protein
LIIYDDEIVGIADFLTPPPHHDQHSPRPARVDQEPGVDKPELMGLAGAQDQVLSAGLEGPSSLVRTMIT